MPTSPVRASSDYPSSIEGDTEVSSATKQKGSDAGANPIPPNVAYRDEIFKAATKYHVDPMWLAAQAAQETGGPTSDSGRNVQQIGGHGHGLFQIDSGTYAPWLKGHHNGMDV